MVCHNGTCWEPFCCLSFILSQPHLDLLPVSIYCDVYLVIFHLLPLLILSLFWWWAMVVAIKEWLSSDDDLLPFNVQWEPAFSERGSQPTCFSPQLSFVPNFMKSLCPQPTPAPKYQASRHAANYSSQLLAGCHLCSYKAANCHCPPFVELCLLKRDCKLVRSACTWSSLDGYFAISIHLFQNQLHHAHYHIDRPTIHPPLHTKAHLDLLHQDCCKDALCSFHQWDDGFKILLQALGLLFIS